METLEVVSSKSIYGEKIKKCVLNLFLSLCLILTWTSSIYATQNLTLILDWFPNVDHLPIYVARHQGYFSQEGLEIKIISPSETADALKLAAAGKVDIAISYEPQTIIAAARGLEIVAFGRLIEHPLTTLLFMKDSGIKVPKDLEGKKIGYTVPGLMDILLEAFAKLNHIEQYTPVNVGFSIVQSLTAAKVDAVMGPFKTYETVEMDHRGYEVAYFELEKWGIPDYDELIFVTSLKNMKKNQAAMLTFKKIVDRAIVYVRANPQKALQSYFAEVLEADRMTETDAFKLTLPYYARDQKMDMERWQKFADFAFKHGLIEDAVDAKKILWPAD
ncbi:MAG: ABC transporter substrate-binding protein [Desulfobacterales bacterium]|jgi:putative hydroxymethylpyrimidine transport system substrate-binding protein